MTVPTFQIVIDCADPHHLVRFWAEALRYEIEDHHELVERMVAEGHATLDDTVVVDGLRVWRAAAACRDPEGVRSRLLFQVVPEPKTVKNRVHIDIHVGAEGRDAEVDRLIGLGAKHLWDGRLGPQEWVTLADPEGNELCVS